MGTEVLRLQDLFAERLRISHAPFQRRICFSGNETLTKLIVIRKTSCNNTDYKKASSKLEKKKFNAVAEGKKSALNEARRKTDVSNEGLLKRGESLISAEMVPKQVCLLPQTDEYAGSAFSSSPSPRSVPLPSFFKKFQLQGNGKMKPDDDFASRDLRRLLRLE